MGKLVPLTGRGSREQQDRMLRAHWPDPGCAGGSASSPDLATQCLGQVWGAGRQDQLTGQHSRIVLGKAVFFGDS